MKDKVSILSENIGGHCGRVRCAKYIPQKRAFITGGEDNKICMWKFDPVNIKPNEIIQANDINKPKVVMMNDKRLFTGYGGKHSSSSNNGNHKKTDWFKPY